MNTFF